MSDKWWEEDAAVSPQEVLSAVGTKQSATASGEQDEGNWWEEDIAFRADVGPEAVLSAIEDEKKRKEDEALLHEAHQSIERWGEVPTVASQIVTDTASVAERALGMGDRADEVNRQSAILDQAMRERDAARWRSGEDPEAELQRNLAEEADVLKSDLDETQKSELLKGIRAKRPLLESNLMSPMEKAGQYVPWLKQGARGTARSLGTAVLGSKGVGALAGAGRIAAGGARGAVAGAAARGSAGAATGAVQGAGVAARGAIGVGGSAYGAIGVASAQEANKAITEGVDAGLKGSALASYVASQGIIEALPATVMQRVGLGGVEAMIAGPSIRGGIKAGILETIKRTGQEIPEELFTEIGHAVANEYSQVDTQALSNDSLASLVADTVLQTVMMGAGAGAMQGLSQAVAKGFVSEDDAKKLGIEGKNRKERLANAKKKIQEAAQAKPQTAPQYKNWTDFGTGEPQGAIPAPPGLDLLDKLRGKKTQDTPPALPPPLPQGAAGQVQQDKPSLAIRNKEGDSVFGSLVKETDDMVVLELDNGEQQWFPKAEWKPHQIGRTEWETKDASQVQQDEARNDAQGNAREGSQVDSSGQVRQPGQEQVGTQPASQEPATQEVQVAPKAAASFEEIQEALDVVKRIESKDNPTKRDVDKVFKARELLFKNGYSTESIGQALASQATEAAKPQPEVSAIADKAEAPSATVRVYHGTDADSFTQFDNAKIGSATDVGVLGAGHYFSTDADGMKRNKKTLIAADVSLANPLKLSMPDFKTDKNALVNKAIGTTGLVGKELSDAIKAKGFDGVELDYSPTGYAHKEYAVFDAAGVKVATAPSASTAGSSEGKADSPTVSPDAPKPSETRKGEAEGEDRSSEASGEGARRMEPTEEGRPADGKPIIPGDRFLTNTGRETTPYPKYSGATNRQTINAEKKAQLWLMENAIAEAESRGDDFNLRTFRNELEDARKGKLPQASKDSATLYVFGEPGEKLRPEPPAGYKALVEFTPVVVESKSPDLAMRDNLDEMKRLNLKPGDAVGYRVYPNPKSTKGGYWQYGTVASVAGSHAGVKRLDGTVERVGGSRLLKLEPIEEQVGDNPAEDEFTAAVNAAFDDRFGGQEEAETPKAPKKRSVRKDKQPVSPQIVKTDKGDAELIEKLHKNWNLVRIGNTYHSAHSKTGEIADSGSESRVREQMIMAGMGGDNVAPPEKKTLTEKAAARKERTSAAKAEKLAKFKDLLKQKKITSGFDPELATAAVELTAAAIDDGVSTFAEYVAWIADNIGESATKTIAPYLEAGWNRLGTYDRFRGKIDKAGKVADVLTDVSDYGTLESPNRVALGKHFQQQLESGKDYKSIVEARKEAATLIAGENANIEPGTPAAKAIDEAVEQGIVRAARDIAESSSDQLKVYDALLDLYERQPRLNVRTGTSMRQQAYSTPAPAAWIASMLSDTSRDNTAYDSSAGNGMLLLGVDVENAIANELNPDRAQALRELGYQVNEGDATKYTPEQKPDRIIINPPFGELEGQRWNVGGITTDKIDHAIVLNSLESLPEDGKAVLIIGSKGFEQRQPKDELRRGEAYKNDKNFYNALYDGYNVTDHFTLHGDMYSKQGAAFPVDVIVIDGRGKSELPKPYQIDRQNAIPRVINSWQELRDVGERYLDTGTGRPSDLSTEQVTDDLGQFSGLLEGQSEGNVQEGGRPNGNTRGGSGVSSRGNTDSQKPRGDSGKSSVSVASNKQGSGESERLSSEDKSGSTPRSDKRDDAGAVDRGPDVAEDENSFQEPYEQRSGSRSVGTLVPTTHVRAVQNALDKAEDRYGNLDEFVAAELGYSAAELEKYFSAEQVDALALTIARHKEGKAFVLGDQTGVGKGRVAAATMIYAKRQGLVPVFMTQSSDLYSDMYRDLQDIGQHSEGEPFYALATNTLTGNDKIELPDGTIITQNAEFAKDTFNAVANNVAAGDGPVAIIKVEKTTDAKGNPLGTTPKGKQRVRQVQEKREYDAVFTAYSQMQTVAGEIKDRHTAMGRIAPNAFFILDESHNAGGVTESNRSGEDEGPTGRAARIRSLVSEAKGVLFLSATFAKNPGVMDLYAKTGMDESVSGSDQDLIETIVKGGLPLQQVLSEMLVESGTYMRREKSFNGIGFSAKVEETGEAEAGEVAGIFDAINVLDTIKNDITKTKSFKRWLTSQGLGLGKDSATGNRGMDSYTFSSIVHNLVDQMLLSIKADAVANEAIASLKRGESPTIALSNTAGSALRNYLENFPAEVGEDIDFGFNTTAMRYLERSRQIMLTETDPSGKKTSRQVRLPDEVLGEDGLRAYNNARELIEGFAADIPASPIDHIRNRIEQAGYKVAEITGRDMMVDYSGEQMRLARRPSEEQGKAGKLASVRAYNAGEIDVLILNQSGSTGLSAHASDKFKNQKRRHMIIAQADKNIDTFMQMLGRINRTGQVEQHEGQGKGSNLPRYTLLMTNVPAEIRPSSVLIKKLSSLNANVTADSKGSVSFDAPDILNKVGDRVVAEYIADNPALNHALGDLVEVNADGAPRVSPDIARKVSGRMAMRPIPEQKAFWDSVTETYAEEIEQLNKLGKNPLAATRMDLGARILERVEIFAGDKTADSPFLQPAYADRVRVKKQGEPMTPDEIKKAINKFYDIRAKRKRGSDPFGDMESEMHREAITGEDVKQNVQELSPDLGKAIREWSVKQGEIATEAIEAKAEQQVARMVNAEAIARVTRRADQAESVIRRRLNSVAPGMAVEVSEVQEEGGYSESISGIVIDVKSKKGKEHLPSGWVATIALSSPDRVVRVPFSRIETAGNSQPGDVYIAPSFEIANDQMYANWEEVGDVYEERIIGTGNVLAAFDQLVSDENRGNIVFFTDEEGNSQRGVLMPRNFSLDKWAEKRPATFATPQQVLDFLSIDPEHQVNDPNFAIQFTLDGSTMNVRSPRSRQRSGKYTTNQELIAASGTDFVSVGQILQMKVRGKKQQLAVIEAAQKLGPLIAANYKEDARNIAGGSSATNRIDVGAINRTSVAAGTSQQSSRADFSFTEGETPEGKRLLNRMKGDSVKRKIGPRSIMNYLKDVVRTGSIEGKSQLSRKNPGHYKPREHLVRTRTGASGVIDSHEAGHALSALLRDVDPKILKRHQAGLVALTYLPNSMASAKTAEEGMAEYVRRFITDYQSIPEPLRANLQADIEMVSPGLLAGLKDTNRLWQQFLARPLQERLDASKNDRQPRKLGRGFRAAVYRSLYNIIGGDVAIHKVRRELERPLFRFSQSLGRHFRELATDTKADIDSAYQSVIRVPVETQRAIFGDSRSKEQGVSVIAFGDGMFSDEDTQFLRDGGFKVPDDFKHGERVYLTNQSFEQIREKLGDNWDSFENYGQLRASLERAEKKGHESAWMHENVSRVEAKQAIADMENSNPNWTQLFDEVREFFDGLLLVATLSGEYSPLEAVRIRNSWDSYWPLLRQVTPEENSRVGRAGPDPAAGVHRAFGSALPLRNLLEAVEMRTKAAMQAYYTNRMMLSMRNYSDTLHAMNDAPFDIRKAGARLMVPLKMDLKKVASLSPEEQAQMIAKYMNEQMQREAKNSGEELDPEELLSVEDIDISTWRPIFRATRPGAIQVIGLTENGQRKYYQVTDPLLFDLFSNSGSMSRYATWLARFFAKGIGPWKRALTQNLAFAVRNLPRDTVTALTMGESGKAFVPGAYLAYGIVGRLNGSIGKDAPARAELFSRSMEVLHQPRHKKVWDSFKESVTEGILVPGYFDMNFYDRVSEAPGQLSAGALLPVTIFNWATGGRYISQMSEELQREGAFLEARSRGRSYEYAQRQYDQISGNFSQRQPNHATATFIRSAGFLNPGLQIMWGQVKRWHDPDPKAQKLYLAKLPALAAWFSVSSAINIALVYAMFGDDKDKLEEVLNDMRERPDYEKDTTMSVMGMVRLPFEYGLSGAVSSFAWNATQDALLGGSNDSIPTRLKAFLARATQVPGPTDAIHPYLKTAIELQMGEAGYSMYRNDSIVPEQLIVQYPVNPELRAYDDTPALFKKIGETARVSPLKVEYAVGSLLTGTASDLLALGGKIVGGKSLEAKDFPIVSRLAQRPSIGFRSQAVRELRKSKQEVEAMGVKINDMGDDATKELLDKYAKLQEVSLAYDVVSSMYDDVQTEVESAETDRSVVEKTERQMTGFARQFLNYQAGKAPPPKQLKERKHEYYGLQAYHATGSPDADSHDKAVAMLKLSGMTYDQTEQALFDYWQKPDKNGKISSLYESGVLKSALQTRRLALKKIYGIE